MEKLKVFLKHYWIFILLATVASGLLIIRLSQGGQTPPSLQPTPAPQSTLVKPKISGIEIPLSTELAITDFSFPSRLKTYRGQEKKIPLPQTTKIAREFKFYNPPQKNEDLFLGIFYTWNSETHFLSIASDSNTIIYGLDLYQSSPPTQGALPSPEVAKSSLENLLEKLDLSPSFELKWQKEEYLVQGYSFPSVNDPEEADFIKVGFNPAVGQHQLVGLDPNKPMVSLILGKGEEIVRFEYQIYFDSLEGQETYELKTEKEIQTILTTEGKIVYAGTYEETTKEPDLVQAEFNQITLAYYQDPDKNPIIQPIYILSGQGTLENGDKTEIIAYLPAIKFSTQTQENLEVPREFFQLPELP